MKKSWQGVFLGAMFLGPTLAMTHGIVSIRMRALASAFLFFVLNLIGLGLGPLITGMISDLLEPSLGSEALRYALVIVVLAGLPSPATAQGVSGVRAPIAAEPEGYALRHETDRIVLLASEGELNASRLAAMAMELGEYAVRVRELLGSDRAPDVQLVVVLDGRGQTGDGPPRIPHVDRPGRIFLYWYREGASDYLVSAAHEMVHAYRRAARTRYAGFTEEGLAQAIALRASPEGGGFPRYGTPIPVAAGQPGGRRQRHSDPRSLEERCDGATPLHDPGVPPA